MKFSGHLRHIVTGGLAGTLLLAAGCATKPQAAPVALADEAEGESKFNTGKVVVVLTDYEGQPLRMARVDI